MMGANRMCGGGFGTSLAQGVTDLAMRGVQCWASSLGVNGLIACMFPDPFQRVPLVAFAIGYIYRVSGRHNPHSYPRVGKKRRHTNRQPNQLCAMQSVIGSTC